MKYKMTIQFELDEDDLVNDPQDLHELKGFVVDALESWGGQRHPADWLFGSLENVTITNINEVTKQGPRRSRPGKKG